MSMDLGIQSFQHEPEYFEAGLYPIAKAAKTAAEDLKAHAPVVLNDDGELAAVTADTIDALYGLLPEAAASGEETVVYLTGEFFADSLVLPDGVTAADIEAALRNIGIFLVYLTDENGSTLTDEDNNAVADA